jgi:hypothetical protein
MTISRKIFINRVTLPPDTPTSLYQLMRDSPAHWGYESTALTTPSLDSIIGSEAGIVPDADVYIGSDETVDSTTGIPLVAARNFSLQDFGPFGIIDPNQIWLYSQLGCQLSVTFQAR